MPSPRRIRTVLTTLALLAAPLAAQAAVPTGNVALAAAGGGTLSLGSAGVFMLHGMNIGPGVVPTGGVTVTSILPGGLLPVQAGGPNWNCVRNGQNVSCTFTGSPLSPNSAFPPVNILANAVVAGPYQTCASIQFTGGVVDSAPTNNTSCASGTVVPPLRNLGLTNSGGGSINWGAQAVFTLAVTNLGPATAASGQAKVTATLPAGLTQPSFTAPSWSCGAVGQVVTCTYGGAATIGPLPPITMRATGSGEGVYSVCASVQSVGMNDPVPANNNGCAGGNVRPRPR